MEWIISSVLCSNAWLVRSIYCCVVLLHYVFVNFWHKPLRWLKHFISNYSNLVSVNDIVPFLKTTTLLWKQLKKVYALCVFKTIYNGSPVQGSNNVAMFMCSYLFFSIIKTLHFGGKCTAIFSNIYFTQFERWSVPITQSL